MDSHGTAHLLLTNTAPNPVEAACLQHEIDDLTATIARARAELDVMETNLQKRKAALSPIRRMPPEIIAQIIRYVAWGVLYSPGRADLVRLTLVCKSWRNAALICHEQWAGIHIEEDEVREPGAFDKIVSWYRRAGSLPKTLEFCLGPYNHCYCDEVDSEEGEPVECEFLHPTLIRLLTEGPILDHILLKVTLPSCFRKLLRAIGAIDPPSDTARRWNAVRWLEIDFSELDSAVWDDDVDPARSIFNYLPQVNSFSLCMPNSFAVFEEDSTAARSVPIHVPASLLQNLTSFTIECDWEGYHILNMLQHCPNVEALDLRPDGNNIFFNDALPVDQSPASRLLFPRLHTLHLQKLGTASILNHLKTPMLRDLQLGFTYDPTEQPRVVDPDFRQTFERFVNDSACGRMIRRLELKKVIIKPKELAETIVILPSLERLAFSDMARLLKKVLIAVTKRLEKGIEDNEPCLPHLEDLELADVPSEMGVGPVCKLVQALPSPKLRLTVIYRYFLRGQGTEGRATEEEYSAAMCRSGVSVRVIPDERSEWFAPDSDERALSEDE